MLYCEVKYLESEKRHN